MLGRPPKHGHVPQHVITINKPGEGRAQMHGPSVSIQPRGTDAEGRPRSRDAVMSKGSKSGKKSSKEIVAEMLQKLERGKKEDAIKRREQQRREALLALEKNTTVDAANGEAKDAQKQADSAENAAEKRSKSVEGGKKGGEGSEESDSSDSDLELEMKVRLKRQASGSGSITPPASTSGGDARARRLSDALTSANVVTKRQKIDVTSRPSGLESDTGANKSQTNNVRK